MSVAAHGSCPNYNRCNKYLEFTLKLDAHEERDRGKNAVIAAQAKRIAELRGGGETAAGRTPARARGRGADVLPGGRGGRRRGPCARRTRLPALPLRTS